MTKKEMEKAAKELFEKYPRNELDTVQCRNTEPNLYDRYTKCMNDFTTAIGQGEEGMFDIACAQYRDIYECFGKANLNKRIKAVKQSEKDAKDKRHDLNECDRLTNVALKKIETLNGYIKEQESIVSKEAAIKKMLLEGEKK